MEQDSKAVWIEKTRELLNEERDAEREESEALRSSLSEKELEERGLCVRKLTIEVCKTGLGGRTVLKLSTKNGLPLPSHKLTTGDMVVLQPSSKTKPMKQEVQVEAVIYKLREKQITIACEEYPENLQNYPVFSLLKAVNEVTYKRLQRALEDVERASHPLEEILFNGRRPAFSTPPTTIQTFNPKMNEPQIEAIKFALSANDIALIHGPPGTGKTTTIVEFILQCIELNQRLLVCAPSNVAVDNIVERLVDSSKKVKMIRLGHPVRLLPTVLRHSLDVRVSHDEGQEVVGDVRKELDRLFTATRNPKTPYEQKKRMRNEIRELRKELTKREEKITSEIVKTCNIILATNVGAADRCLTNEKFDVVVIDEAAQALEASCWIPILRGKKVVLAGDHCQLPPTIKSHEAEKKGLGLTLFERLSKKFPEAVKMLSIQYRMHSVISEFSSKAMYSAKLVSDQSVAQHLLLDLPNIENNEWTDHPLHYIDTAGCNFHEEKDDEESTRNVGEAGLVVLVVKTLINAGVNPEDIGIITPYNAQVRLLKLSLSPSFPNLEIGSVDKLQGREKEAIVISLVRSNTSGEVGFLAESRRLNVALTRARRSLTVIGDSVTLVRDPFIKQWIEFARQSGDLRSAAEFSAEIDSEIPVINPKESKGKAPLTKAEGKGEKKTEKKVEKKEEKKAPKKVMEKKAAAVKKAMDITELIAEDKKKESGKVQEKKKQASWEDSLDDAQRKLWQALEGKLKAFVESDAKEIKFDSSLSSFERRVVHEISERMGLSHVSMGGGEQRFITVSKPKPKVEKKAPPVEAAAEEQDKAQEEEEVEEEGVEDKEEEAEEEEAEVQNNQTEKPKQQPQQQQQQQQEKKKKKKKKKAEGGATKKDKEFDLDAFIDKNARCQFPNCKESIKMIGEPCSICKMTFCLKHAMPEVHSPNQCGVQLKAKIRHEWVTQKKTEIKNGVIVQTEKPLKDWERTYLQKKLQDKIKDARGGNNSKKKKDNKKK